MAVGEDLVPPIEPMADESRATDNGWPRIMRAGDLDITVYQPQVEAWDDNRIRSRAAVAVKSKASPQPVYGVVWFSARTDVDRENRLVERREEPPDPGRGWA